MCSGQPGEGYLSVHEKAPGKERLGKECGLLDAYEKENRLTREEHVQLCYRLSYPEKFWKIVNFYYNTGKAWIPGKNMEKLEKIHLQEKEKINFLQAYKKKYDILI